MSRPLKIVLAVALVLVAIVLFALTPFGGSALRRLAIDVLTPEYHPPADAGDKTAIFDGLDADRPRIEIGLGKLADGFEQPVAVVPVPGEPGLLVVLEKAGKAWWFDRAETQTRGVLVDVPVLVAGEQGLLGIVFHPRFAENGRFFVNATVAADRGDVTRVMRFAIPAGSDLRQAKPTLEQTVIEIEQPYQNHNAGDLAFGPDGMLYVGLGDGGFADDPHGHGQDRTTLLGAMLRLDVDGATAERGYAIPPDNPFAGAPSDPDGTPRPEIWAWGLRNPWRYSFAPDGRLVIGDVGQDMYEEVTLVGAGQNAGWAIREAAHCFPPEVDDCPTEGLIDPIYEYGRQDGGSITGGHVYTGDGIPELKGRYVFGDFLSGRLWALDLPPTSATPGAKPDGIAQVHSLGRWGILVSAFGRTADGEVLAVDFGGGAIYQLVAAR